MSHFHILNTVQLVLDNGIGRHNGFRRLDETLPPSSKDPNC